VLACFRELIADSTWQQLLIVAHGGVNRAILCHALGSGLPGFAAIEQDACCCNIIDLDANGRFVPGNFRTAPTVAVSPHDDRMGGASRAELASLERYEP